MPTVDIELVCASHDKFERHSAQALADCIGKALGTPPGRSWVRLHCLLSRHYAENGTVVDGAALPAFVTVLQSHPPSGAALPDEITRLTTQIAKALGRPAERVHILYAPAASGRQAFGGRLVP